MTFPVLYVVVYTACDVRHEEIRPLSTDLWSEEKKLIFHNNFCNTDISRNIANRTLPFGVANLYNVMI